MFVKLGRKLASQDSKTRVVCDGKLMWKKNPRKNRVLKSRYLVFTFLLPLTPLFFFFLWVLLFVFNFFRISNFHRILQIVLILLWKSSL